MIRKKRDKKTLQNKFSSVQLRMSRYVLISINKLGSIRERSPEHYSEQAHTKGYDRSVNIY